MEEERERVRTDHPPAPDRWKERRECTMEEWVDCDALRMSASQNLHLRCVGVAEDTRESKEEE